MPELMGQSRFELNELIAIHSALEIQIDDSKDYLKTMNLSLPEKIKLQQVINYSQSAYDKLNAIFELNNINPIEN